MDEIDAALMAGWAEVARRVRADRGFAARRVARVLRFRAAGAKGGAPPLLAWCAKLRACDLRLDRVVKENWRDGEAWLGGEAHRVLVTQALLSRLIEPVWMRWPPVYHLEACAKLGITRHQMNRWIRRKAVQAEWWRGWPHGLAGRPRPYVWSDYALDPQAPEGRRPEAEWGTLWQVHWRRVPASLRQVVWRVPRVHRYRGGTRQLGWLWVCGCGRVARKLYLPLPTWTVADYLGSAALRGLPAELRVALRTGGAGEPGEPVGPGAVVRMRCFECVKPKVAAATTVGVAWHLFVTHVTGGLLQGSEVRRPAGACEKAVRYPGMLTAANRARLERGGAAAAR
mgnify:CR=1 FL=1